MKPLNFPLLLRIMNLVADSALDSAPSWTSALSRGLSASGVMMELSHSKCLP